MLFGFYYFLKGGDPSKVHAPRRRDPVTLLRLQLSPAVQHPPRELHALRLLDVVKRHVLRLRILVEAAPPVARQVGRARHDVDVPGEGV